MKSSVTIGDVSAQEISRCLSEKHKKINDLYFDECKNGSTWFAKNGEQLRLDGWAMNKSYANPTYTGYEIKVDRGDFMRDEKWERYLPYCHRFYFVCPRGLIKMNEITDPNVGLIYYNRDSPVQKLRTVKTCHKRSIDTPPAEFFQYLLFSRVDKQDYKNPQLSDEEIHAQQRQWKAQKIYEFVKSQDGQKMSIANVGWMLQDQYHRKWAELQEWRRDTQERERAIENYLKDEEILELLYKYFPKEANSFSSTLTTKEERRKRLDEAFRKVYEAKIPKDMDNTIRDIINSVVHLEGILDKKKGLSLDQ
jgi:hypothetical protein